MRSSCSFTRTSAPLLLMALRLVILASSAKPQSRPLGVAETIADQPETAADTLRVVLGDCPVELLRQVWSEMDALQAGERFLCGKLNFSNLL